MLQIARTVAACRVIIPSVVRALHRHCKGLGSSVVPEELQLMMMNFFRREFRHVYVYYTYLCHSDYFKNYLT